MTENVIIPDKGHVLSRAATICERLYAKFDKTGDESARRDILLVMAYIRLARKFDE